MMKSVKKLWGITLIFFVLFAYFFEPLDVMAKEAETLADLRKELTALKNEKSANEKEKKSTQSEINSKKNAVYSAYNEIEKAKSDIESAQSEIESSQKGIDKITAETEELLRFMQQISGDNAYLEYIFGASSITEMIMRMDAIDQITNYNRKQLEKLEELINYNEQLKVELAQKQVDLQTKITSYQAKIKVLGKDLAELAEVSEDINDQIKNQNALIKSYEEMGCKEDQLLKECVNIANNAGWLKPLNKGVVTSLWGYRIHPIKKTYTFHNGIDLAGNGEGTKIYAAASGTVAAITIKSSCGGNKVYIHSYVNGKAYTHYYFHLLAINVSVGDTVTTNTIVGTVGGGAGTKSYDGCTTGAHLHFGIGTGFYLGAGAGSYSSYSKLISNNINPPGFPGKGSWFYKRT